MYKGRVAECDTSIKSVHLLSLVSLHEISVDHVEPLYGPISGGTRVIISGRFLSASTVTDVHIGQYSLKPRTVRSYRSFHFKFT